MRFRLFAPLRAKVTSSTRSLALLSQGLRLLILATPHAEVRGASFDHFVGEREQLVWNLEAKRLGGLEIDGQFELCRILHWKVRGLCTLENTIDIQYRFSIQIEVIGPKR